MIPVQLTIRDIPTSSALETHLRTKTEKLAQYYKRISSCRVVVGLTQKHKHQGKLYTVHIDVTVPGKELVVTKKYDQNIYVAIRDAFDAIVRQLEEHSRRRHGRVKTHDNLMHGSVKRIITNEGYGFIEGIDGNEYYFSMTNVSYPDFAQLTIGDMVVFIAQPFNDGMQAHRITREKQNHAA